MVEPSFNRSNRSGESVNQASAGRVLTSQSLGLTEFGPHRGWASQRLGLTLEAKLDIGDFEG